MVGQCRYRYGGVNFWAIGRVERLVHEPTRSSHFRSKGCSAPPPPSSKGLIAAKLRKPIRRF
jgi:hypothetical protein